MTRQRVDARFLIILVLSAASPAGAGLNPSAAPIAAPVAASASQMIGSASQRVQAAGPAADSTTVLDINGSGAIRLHNRFLAGGLLLYVAVMLGALVFLEKRRVAAAVILGAGLVVGGLLLARAFG